MREFLEDMLNLLHAIFFAVSALCLIIISTRLISSYEQAQYLKSHYNIEVSVKDIFWNEKLVMSELRSKGIITDNNENNNVTINKGE